MSSQNVFDIWDKRATVRRKNRSLLDLAEIETKHLWVPEVVPASLHPDVQKLGPEIMRALEVGHFYRFHHFTEKLEYTAVNPVAIQIAHNMYPGVALPKQMRREAYGLYTDEAYHAQNSADLIAQVEETTGIYRVDDETPLFLKRLWEMQSRMPESLRGLIELMFVVVSETLITHTFSDLPKDERLVTLVRQNIRDHGEDEGRHAAYFSKFFELVWPQLSAQDRAALGAVLPDLIFFFCEADYPSITTGLERCGVSPAHAETIVNDCYPQDKIVASAKKSSTASVQLFKRCGVLDNPKTADAFHKAGLI
jgi:hypothetical protein